MKLFYAPGACSLSPHIALREAGLKFDLAKVDLGAKTVEDGSDFNAVNPKGYVPVLQLDNGEYLTEGPAIVQYIADQNPASGLAPPAGNSDRYRLQEWLTYLNSEVHKNFSPLFNPTSTDDMKTAATAALDQRLGYVAEQLDGKEFLVGDNFSVADGYLFTILGWGKFVGMDIAKWPALAAYAGNIAQRPAVQEALQAEGLLG